MYGQLLDEVGGSEKENEIDRIDKMKWADKVNKAERLEVSDD